MYVWCMAGTVLGPFFTYGIEHITLYGCKEHYREMYEVNCQGHMNS